MHIISKRTLREFWELHPDAEQPLLAWHAEVKHADWSSPNDVKAQYGSASILKGCRIVFNIAGNSYRLVVHVNYAIKVVYIRFVGTHSEYDSIDAELV